MLSPEIHRLSDRLWVWQHYDPAVKAELFSSAILTSSGLYVVDPIPLAEDSLRELSQVGPIAGIIVTNANHHRSVGQYSDRFSVPVFAHPNAFPDSKPNRFNEVIGASPIGGDLEVIEIDGAVAGEIALHEPSNGGTLIIGDALINFEPDGFTFLPRKYCENEKQMRQSLTQLLTCPAERMLFAHGTPILSGATNRLRELLDSQ